MTDCRCTFCDAPIVPKRDYQKVTGFVRWRPSGGPNAIALREPSETWACMHCIGKAQGGVAPAQGELL